MILSRKILLESRSACSNIYSRRVTFLKYSIRWALRSGKTSKPKADKLPPKNRKRKFFRSAIRADTNSTETMESAKKSRGQDRKATRRSQQNVVAEKEDDMQLLDIHQPHHNHIKLQRYVGYFHLRKHWFNPQSLLQILRLPMEWRELVGAAAIPKGSLPTTARFACGGWLRQTFRFISG